MLSKEYINDLIAKVYLEILEEDFINKKDEYFTGPNSIVESINIIQMISAIEDDLELNNVVGYDLLERVFENDSLTYSQLSELIYNDFIK